MTNRLGLAQRLQALAQAGLTYAKDPFDRERYEQARAIAAELLADLSDEPAPKILGLLQGESGYATPKVDVRGVVFRGNELLMVRERSDGLWTLPGGWVDVGESPRLACVREIREESGYETRAVKLLAVYDKLRHDHPPELHHAYKLFIACDLVGGEPTTSHEIQEVGFFAEGALPPLSTPRATAAQLARMFEHRRHPEWPTDLD